MSSAETIELGKILVNIPVEIKIIKELHVIDYTTIRQENVAAV